MEKEQEVVDIFTMKIFVKSNGKIGFEVDAEDKDNIPDPIKLVGLLEVVKADVMATMAGDGRGPAEEDMFTEVTLEEEDFELPQSETLVEMGKKVGDTVLMPKPIAFAREAMISEMKAAKTNKGKEIQKPTTEA